MKNTNFFSVDLETGKSRIRLTTGYRLVFLLPKQCLELCVLIHQTEEFIHSSLSYSGINPLVMMESDDIMLPINPHLPTLALELSLWIWEKKLKG